MTSPFRSIFSILILFAVLASLLGSALIVTPAYALSIDVTTTDDELNNDGDCSLREAIQTANTNAPVDACTTGAGADLINLPAGTYTLTIPGAGENANATGDLDITQALIINGAGAGITTIQAGATPGSGIDRVLHIGSVPVIINKVTIANGLCAFCDGGGINSTGKLNVTNSIILNNYTNNNNYTVNGGGGIYYGGTDTLTVTNSTFSGNSAFNNFYATYGGSIYNLSSLTVTNSTFSGNTANYGGGIDNLGTATVTNSTFSNNESGFGGILNSGVLSVTNSTFFGNLAVDGGGIANLGTATVANSTFSGNIVSTTSDGGGIYNGTGGSLTLNNSILANSTSTNSTPTDDCYSTYLGTVSGTNNLIELDGSGGNVCGTTGPIHSDPDLGTLTGSPAYFPIQPNSPAFDAGDDAICAAAPVGNTSQNGATRPQGAHCDIGSYEFADTTPPTVFSITRADINPTSAAVIHFTVTFSEAVTGVDAADFNMTSTGTISAPSVSGVSGGPKTYTIAVNSGTGSGTIRLNVVDDDSIVDAADNRLGGTGVGNGDFITGEAYGIRTTSFADVSYTYWAWQYIERLYNAGITGGCGSAPLIYCPEDTVTRAQMAIFLERGMHGSTYTPPAATGTYFGDVPISYWSAAWIEKLFADGITGGCGGVNYCPENVVTRAQMAIFLLRARHGSGYTPPAATGVFTDVLASYWAANWIEQLAAEGITGGCGGGNYCPEDPVTRAQMAIFLVRTFNLP
jgi:CSLREA domain-containing protein